MLELRFPVESKPEADQRAAAELAKRANELVKGEGETCGLPELLPDTKIALEGFGEQVLNDLLRDQDGSSFDGSGYRTRFSIEEAGRMNAVPPSISRAGHEAAGLVAGVATATVSRNNDPEGLGPGEAKLPWREPDFETDWGASWRRWRWRPRRVFLPEVGDEVLVGFERDDIRYPYVLGALWSNNDKPPKRKATKRTTCALSSRARGTFYGSTTAAKGSIAIELSDGKKIEIDDDGIRVDRQGEPHHARRQERRDQLEAHASLTLKAPKISDQASASLDLKAGGALTGSAGIVKIN